MLPNYIIKLPMQYGHTPLSYSKGLLLQKKVRMYKHLVKVLFPEEGEQDITPMSERGHGATAGGATPIVSFAKQMHKLELAL